MPRPCGRGPGAFFVWDGLVLLPVSVESKLSKADGVILVFPAVAYPPPRPPGDLVTVLVLDDNGLLRETCALVSDALRRFQRPCRFVACAACVVSDTVHGWVSLWVCGWWAKR